MRNAITSELLEGDVFALHLAPDRIGRFLATGDDRSAEPALRELSIELGEDARHDAGALVAQV
jgi:hypothetical protein